MPVPAVHLLIALRGPVWRVRILIPGQPRPHPRAHVSPTASRSTRLQKPWLGGARKNYSLVVRISHVNFKSTAVNASNPTQKKIVTHHSRMLNMRLSMLHLFGFGGSVGGGCERKARHCRTDIVLVRSQQMLSLPLQKVAYCRRGDPRLGRKPALGEPGLVQKRSDFCGDCLHVLLISER